jgi:hypothetical protein
MFTVSNIIQQSTSVDIKTVDQRRGLTQGYSTSYIRYPPDVTCSVFLVTYMYDEVQQFPQPALATIDTQYRRVTLREQQSGQQDDEVLPPASGIRNT